MIRFFSVVLAAVVTVGAVCGCGRGSDVATTGDESIYALAAAGDTSSVAAAIRSGFDVNRPDENGMTVLHHAVRNNQTGLAETLIEDFRALPTIPDAQGQTAIDYARAAGNGYMLNLLQGEQ